MANHPNRNLGYVIQLANGRLWKNHGAESAAVFSSRVNAESTIAGFSGRGALANPTMRKLVGATHEGAVKIAGYWMI